MFKVGDLLLAGRSTGVIVSIRTITKAGGWCHKGEQMYNIHWSETGELSEYRERHLGPDFCKKIS